MKECPSCGKISFQHNSSRRRYECYLCNHIETLEEKKKSIADYHIQESLSNTYNTLTEIIVEIEHICNKINRIVGNDSYLRTKYNEKLNEVNIGFRLPHDLITFPLEHDRNYSERFKIIGCEIIVKHLEILNYLKGFYQAIRLVNHLPNELAIKED